MALFEKSSAVSSTPALLLTLPYGPNAPRESNFAVMSGGASEVPPASARLARHATHAHLGEPVGVGLAVALTRHFDSPDDPADPNDPAEDDNGGPKADGGLAPTLAAKHPGGRAGASLPWLGAQITLLGLFGLGAQILIRSVHASTGRQAKSTLLCRVEY